MMICYDAMHVQADLDAMEATAAIPIMMRATSPQATSSHATWTHGQQSVHPSVYPSGREGHSKGDGRRVSVCSDLTELRQVLEGEEANSRYDSWIYSEILHIEGIIDRSLQLRRYRASGSSLSMRLQHTTSQWNIPSHPTVRTVCGECCVWRRDDGSEM